MLRAFMAYYRPFMGLFWLDFGCAVVSGLLELAFPLAITAFIDQLLPQGNWPLTVLAAAGLLVLYAVNAGLLVIVTYWGHKLGINIETEMRARAFDHLTRLSWRWYDRARTGKLVARVTRASRPTSSSASAKLGNAILCRQVSSPEDSGL